MTLLDKLFGRLGNSFFQYAFLYSYAKDNDIDFYFQDPKFFERYERQIKQLFGQNIPAKTDMVAIHVRRGDYVNNSFYVDLMETPYYEDAMAEFPNESFLIFSDDVEWCKQQPIFKGCEFSEGRNEEEDLNLMASCTGIIMANSSFSWWASYLSPYAQKIIAPNKDKYYTDGIERTVCPNTWLRL